MAPLLEWQTRIEMGKRSLMSGCNRVTSELDSKEDFGCDNWTYLNTWRAIEY